MSNLIITIGDERFPARFEHQAAPLTCARFQSLLPFQDRIIHVRWSGEACWIPMGERDLGLGPENATSYPAPGQVVLYPGGISETEILIAYGPTRFASKAGQLAGNHFGTIIEGLDRLAALGRAILWEGARPIRFEAAA
ncbi:DUF3830 family protein [Phenylobacterium montanum]|uniref:DUF3830 family protein n=1 Tax=Phenylobacterium montanum TaxID=2823693 RepID=A0A975FZ63_9CAUL|nr:DUF3830 family protein [Caulobacter sp. S6]QUD87622.1 DUF3830 family protein [Caulobacter sp. S6]